MKIWRLWRLRYKIASDQFRKMSKTISMLHQLSVWYNEHNNLYEHTYQSDGHKPAEHDVHCLPKWLDAALQSMPGQSQRTRASASRLRSCPTSIPGWTECATRRWCSGRPAAPAGPTESTGLAGQNVSPPACPRWPRSDRYWRRGEAGSSALHRSCQPGCGGYAREGNPWSRWCGLWSKRHPCSGALGTWTVWSSWSFDRAKIWNQRCEV